MDQVANAIAKVKNALSRKAPKVELVKTGLVANLLSVLKKEGFIEDFKDSNDRKYHFSVSLKYFQGKPVIEGFRKVSKQSRRYYVGSDSIPRVYNNLGIAVISTSKGVLTDKEAKVLGVGGEVICYVW